VDLVVIFFYLIAVFGVLIMYIVYLVKRSKKICSDAAYLEDKCHYRA